MPQIFTIDFSGELVIVWELAYTNQLRKFLAAFIEAIAEGILDSIVSVGNIGIGSPVEIGEIPNCPAKS
jgi:hypothetical protein